MKTRTVAFAAGIILLAAPGFAQKPKSQKEIEALQAIQNATDPDARLKAIDNLLTNFADTEYKIAVLDMAVETARQKNDATLVNIWADRALQVNPKDYIAMDDLAAMTAGQMKEFDLNLKDEAAKVDKNARGAIDNIKDATKPNPSMTDTDWAGYKADLVAAAHEALGLSAMAQKNYTGAIDEYKLGLAAHSNSVLMVRLGQAYTRTKQYDEAIAQFTQAMADAGASTAVKQVAQAGKVNAEKLKAAASAAPAAPAPAPPPAPKP